MGDVTLLTDACIVNYFFVRRSGVPRDLSVSITLDRRKVSQRRGLFRLCPCCSAARQSRQRNGHRLRDLECGRWRHLPQALVSTSSSSTKATDYEDELRSVRAVRACC